MTTVTSVVLVDDHPVVRDGLAFLLGEQADFTIVGEAASASEALLVVTEARPDLIVLDLNLQGEDAIPLIGQLRQELPDLRILVLSMHDEDLYAERLLELGAQGYVMKQEEPAEFLHALRHVAAGKTYLSARMTQSIAARGGRSLRRDTAVHLTEREQDVMRLVAQGLGTREMAAQLGMSTKTVDSHRRNIREKLGLTSSRDLVRYAVHWIDGPADASGERS